MYRAARSTAGTGIICTKGKPDCRVNPESQLSRWYQERFVTGSSRLRRIGIVALARKLLIALWRYLEDGVIPEGAVVKAQTI
jgi:transposase